jgi:hypothetical protein
MYRTSKHASEAHVASLPHQRKKKISRLSYLQLYNIEGTMSIPVLGSKIRKKHSSIILKAIINFMLHSAMSAISAAAQTF